ncbi:glycosyltransferase [Salinispira pacifica]|uniref:Glycosyltransferase n=1 Tax=Salinispira pacifica TaxID=1307761 RepID=V5WLE7_9SPIO|nr:glycosyltransferase [Salinispira pacifica]AHC16480.1 Glycosyltransferase [Salinispira pacifica]
MQKILLLGNLDSIHLQKVVAGLDKSKYKVFVVGGSRNKPVGLYPSHVFLYTSKFRGKLSYLAIAIKFLLVSLKVSPDIINAHYATSYGFISTLYRKNCVRIISVWGSDLLLFPHRSRLHLFLSRYILDSADAIFATSKILETSARNLCNKPVHITPFGINTRLFQRVNVKNVTSKAIGTVKGLEDVYGIDRLIRVFAKWKKQYNGDLLLRIAGDGSKAVSLYDLCVELGIENSVEFVGRISQYEVPKFLSSLSIYFALSRSESFGVAVLEASACEVPVIVTEVGGLPEVVVDGTTGYIVPESELDQIPKIMNSILENPDHCSELGRAGRKFVVANFSLNETSRVYNKQIENVLKSIDRV